MNHEDERDYDEERANEDHMRRENESEARHVYGDEDECECTDEYGPCEAHSETIIVREGASTRTADDLVATFLEDVAGMWEDVHGTAPVGDAYVLARDFRQAVEDEQERERERAAREGGYAYVSGWAPESGTVTREDGSTYTWDEYEMGQALSDAISTGESDLCDLGWSVTWEDGYRIYRVTGGPFYEPPTDEDEAPTDEAGTLTEDEYREHVSGTSRPAWADRARATGATVWDHVRGWVHS